MHMGASARVLCYKNNWCLLTFCIWSCFFWAFEPRLCILARADLQPGPDPPLRASTLQLCTPRGQKQWHVRRGAMGGGSGWGFPPCGGSHLVWSQPVCCLSTAYCLQLWAQGGQDPYFLWFACIKSRGKGEFHHPARLVVGLVAKPVLAGLDPTSLQVHTRVCVHTVSDEHFVRRAHGGRCMHLSDLIYSVVFYLIGFSPPLFPHVLRNTRKVLHFSLLCMFDKCVSDDFGRLLKRRIELLWLF